MKWKEVSLAAEELLIVLNGIEMSYKLFTYLGLKTFNRTKWN